MTSPLYQRMFDHICKMPVVDTHEHIRVLNGQIGSIYQEPIQALVVGYLSTDFLSAGAKPSDIELLQNPEVSTDEKWPIFQPMWESCQHTAYARVTQIVLRQQYGIRQLNRAGLDRVAEKLANQSPQKKLEMMEHANIKAVITDWLYPHPSQRHLRYYSNPVLKNFLEQPQTPLPLFRNTFNLPYFHEIRTREFIEFTGRLASMIITSMENYEEALFNILTRSKELGVVAIKDQSAYRRPIDFSFPSRADAERVFNRLLTDGRAQLAWPDARPLDDYLFQQSMRFACELNLPVQIHTGHVTGLRNQVDKANAAQLAPTLEAHCQVNFDLFHGNWPYMGDLLFLAKSYPNVYINLCWLYIIDPIYARELLKRAVMTVPHIKIFAFGGDYWDAPEFSLAHLELAKQVIAEALTELVEESWVEEEQAVKLALDWLYNNPNRFYRLGLPGISL